VHPDLRRVAPVLPRVAVGPRTIPVVRVLERLIRKRPPPRGVQVERVGAVEVRVHRPPVPGAGPFPAVLWIHGGGYVMGTAAQDDRLCAEFARRLGAVVAAVDYRLAPEHPAPVPLEDCHDALVWLATRAVVDGRRVAVAGASAGGGLAAALAQLAVARGEVRPVFQLLTYPMLDDRTVLRDDVDERGFRLWTNRSNRFGWTSYLGTGPGGPGALSPYVPARAEDLSALPPAWIGVGDLDLFHDEDVAYAERLREAGVPCRLDVVAGAFHGFDAVVPTAPVSRVFRDAQVSALARALAPLPADARRALGM
jgi:acetyl esterase/lipase